ncbi:MAG: hypothetical protein R6U98_05470 [Pirellulaceae bacterium]
MESRSTQAVLPLVGLAADKVIRDRSIMPLPGHVREPASPCIFQAVGFFRVESCPTQAVLPLVGLAAEKVIRDQYIVSRYACPGQRFSLILGARNRSREASLKRPCRCGGE